MFFRKNIQLLLVTVGFRQLLFRNILLIDTKPCFKYLRKNNLFRKKTSNRFYTKDNFVL